MTPDSAKLGTPPPFHPLFCIDISSKSFYMNNMQVDPLDWPVTLLLQFQPFLSRKRRFLRQNTGFNAGQSAFYRLCPKAAPLQAWMRPSMPLSWSIRGQRTRCAARLDKL
jgi:hypothetical protein